MGDLTISSRLDEILDNRYMAKFVAENMYELAGKYLKI